MSSTIDRHRCDRGQVLVLFTGAVVLIVLVAGLVFDIGQTLYQRRQQQDAADAAALAGARWLVETSTSCKSNPSVSTCANAVQAARAIAVQHGFSSSQVTVNIPPAGGTHFDGSPGYIQVTIGGRHESWFSGIAGIGLFNITTVAVAANIAEYSFPYSFLALNPTCDGGSGGSQVNGNGTVTIGGRLQVNTEGCGSAGALAINGNGHDPLAVTAVGGCGVSDTDPGYKLNGSHGPNPSVDCPGLPTTGVDPVPDPLAGLEVNLGVVAATPTPDVRVVLPVGGVMAHDSAGCPGGGQEGTAANPKDCSISLIGNDPITTVILGPGVYWGGLSIAAPATGKTLNVYLLPGIYAMAGGGFKVTGTGNGTIVLRTVASLSDTTTGGGILIYNTDDPVTCPTTACIGAISVTGSTNSSSMLQLMPYQFDPYRNLLIYQDRNASSQPDIDITGQGAIEVAGTVYAPNAEVKIAGQGSGISAQVIAGNFSITGNGNLNITYEADSVHPLTGQGLVQ